MHVPDGFLDVATSTATGAVAVGGVGLALRRSQEEVAETGPALPGLTAAFVFAVQMVNFPVGAGTSGHLLGGALAAVLVGPWTAVLVLTTVLVVQALLFADGGMTALGTNVVLMAVVTTAVGYGVTRAVLAALPRRPTSVVPAAALGALLSVPAAALAFTGLYAVGGTTPIPLAALGTGMVAWHAVIGVGEAVITAAIVASVVAVRPDLVHAARHLRPAVLLVGADGSPLPARGPADGPAEEPGTSADPGTAALATGLLAALVVGGLVSLAASSHPDGLEFVADAVGLGDAATDSATAAGPLAGYGVAGLDGALPAAAAGVIGVLVTVSVGVAVALVARLRRGGPDTAAGEPAAATRRADAAPTDGLLVLRRSPVHRLPAHVKVVSLVAFVLVVVATPTGWWATFAACAGLLAAVGALARVPARLVLRRLAVEAPFVVFALLLPLVAAGPRVQVGPVGLSQAGLLGGGTLLAKATLGVTAAILLAATTSPRDLLGGLDRLRLPRALVSIVSFMVRYVAVVASDLQRMRVARDSRGEPPGRSRQIAAVAAGAGTLFVRSYERGERVHHAMLARGYDGRVPALLGAGRATARAWATGLVLPLAAASVLLASWVVR